MKETDADINELQLMLDASLARATDHLRSIIVPGKNTLNARQLVSVIRGMRVLSVATVSTSGEPRISAVDGHFIRGHWVFSTECSSAKARQLNARPAISAAHLDGEILGVFTHGIAETLNPAGQPPHPEWEFIHQHLAGHYGGSPLEWGDIVCYRIRPHWMVAYSGDPEKLLAK